MLGTFASCYRTCVVEKEMDEKSKTYTLVQESSCAITQAHILYVGAAANAEALQKHTLSEVCMHGTTN